MSAAESVGPSRLRQWLKTTALTNPVERGQATALQVMLLLFGGFGALLITLLLIALIGPGTDATERNVVLQSLALATILIGCAVAALVILRRGHFQASVLLATVSFTILHAVTVITSDLANTEVLLVYVLPITLAGLLSSRRALPVVLLLAWGTVWFAALTAPVPLLPPTGLPEIGDPSPPVVTAFNFMLITTIAGVFFAAFGHVLSDALTRALARERDLDDLRQNLEQTVDARTAELRAALAEVEARAEEEAKLRREAEEQRALVRGMSVPVLPVTTGTLVIPLVGDLDAPRMAMLQERALTTVERSRCERLVFDITGVPIVDTQVAQGLIQVMLALRLLGTESILVGIRPEVAQTLVSLGVTLDDVPTFADLQTALQGTMKSPAARSIPEGKLYV